MDSENWFNSESKPWRIYPGLKTPAKTHSIFYIQPGVINDQVYIYILQLLTLHAQCISYSYSIGWCSIGWCSIGWCNVILWGSAMQFLTLHIEICHPMKQINWIAMLDYWPGFLAPADGNTNRRIVHIIITCKRYIHFATMSQRSKGFG